MNTRTCDWTTLDGLQRIHVQPDALVLTDGAGAIKRFEPTAGGGLLFGPSATYGSGRGFGLAAGDFDNDLDIDLAVPHHNNGVIYIFLNDGDGTFTEAATVVQATAPDLRIPDVAVGDFDEDGNLDLVSHKTLQGEAYVFFGNGDGTFDDVTPLVLLLASPDVVGVADFDGDVNDDIVFTGGSLNLFLGDGAGNFPTQTNEPGIGGQETMLVADLDDDGFADIAVAASSGGGSVRVTLNDADGLGTPGDFQLAATTYTPIPYAGGRGRWALAAADFNEDGFTDIVVANTTNEVTILFGDGNRVFNNPLLPPIVVPTLAAAHSLVAVDIDLDGHIDIATSESGGNRVEVLLGNGDGTFAAPVAFDTETDNGLTGMVTADFNGDGRPDMAIGNSALAAPILPLTVLLSQPGGGEFAGPAGDFSTITQNMDGSFTRLMKDGTTIEFDTAGLQTAVIDRNGNATAYAYDVDDNLETITDPVGLVTTFAYSGGLLTSVTDPALRVTAFAHDANGNLTQITDPDQSVRRFAYDARHRLVSQTSKRGFDTAYSFGFHGRNTRADRPDGSNVLIAPSRVVGLIDPVGPVGTEANPAPFTRVAEVEGTFTDGNGNTTTFGMNKFGGVLQRTGRPCHKLGCVSDVDRLS